MRTKVYLTAIWRMLLGLSLLLGAAGCDGSSSAYPQPATTQASGINTGAGTASSAATPVSTRTTRPGGVPASATPAPTRPQPSPTRPPAINLTADDLSGQAITFWHPWSGEKNEAIQQLIDHFNRGNPYDLSVEVQAFNGMNALQEAFQAAEQSGTLPDLLVAYPYQARQLDLNGQTLVDLNAYLYDSNWGFSDGELEDFYPQFWEQDTLTVTLTSQGPAVKRLGLPFYHTLFFVVYNQTWATELGYDEPPATPFDLRLQACAASGNEVGGWMITDSGSLDDQAADPPASLLLGWVGAYGGQITRPDGSGYQFDNPGVEHALGFLKGMQNSACAWLGRDLDPAAAFAARQALFYAAGLPDLPAQRAAMQAASNRDRWTVLPFPGNGESMNGDGSPVVDATSMSLSITRSTPERQLATWLLLEWLISPSGQAHWANASGYAPVRPSTLELLDSELKANPQWATALSLLPYAQPQPSYASWGVTRGMVGDALKQLLTPTFTAAQIPDLIQVMEILAEEIHSQIR